MKTNFTPGPWVLSEKYRQHDRRLARQVCSQGEEFQIAKVNSSQHEGLDIDIEMDANARLIAAAPDLLDALVQISIASSDGKLSLHDQWVISTCQAAIAKALGE